MDDRIHIIKLNPSSRKGKQKMPDDREGLLPFTERTEDGIRIFRYEEMEALRMKNCLKYAGMQIRAMYREEDHR